MVRLTFGLIAALTVSLWAGDYRPSSNIVGAMQADSIDTDTLLVGTDPKSLDVNSVLTSSRLAHARVLTGKPVRRHY